MINCPKTCCSRALLYVYTWCRARGSIVKHLYDHDIERARVASMQRLELNERIRELSNEKQSMLERQMALKREVQVLDKQLVKL